MISLEEGATREVEEEQELDKKNKWYCIKRTTTNDADLGLILEDVCVVRLFANTSDSSDELMLFVMMMIMTMISILILKQILEEMRCRSSSSWKRFSFLFRHTVN